MMNNRDLSIVIPAQDEAYSLPVTLRTLIEAFHHSEIQYEIVVVDDGSDDGTADAVRRLRGEYSQIRLVTNLAPHGFGYAVRRGLQFVEGDNVVIFMADGSDDPNDALRYYQKLQEGADCCFGTRWSDPAHVQEYPPFKKLCNRWGNKFIARMFKLKYDDLTNAFKAYKREVIDDLLPTLQAGGFDLTIELPLKAVLAGYSYEVIPIHWFGRKEGDSKFSLPRTLYDYLYRISAVRRWNKSSGQRKSQGYIR